MGLCASKEEEVVPPKPNPVAPPPQRPQLTRKQTVEEKVQHILSKAKKHRKVIQDQADYDPNCQVPVFPKSKRVKNMIEEVLLNKFFMFEQFNDNQRNDFLMAMENERFSETKQVVIKEGDHGDYMYVVETGEFEVSLKKTGVVATLEAPCMFGELALIYDAPRAATIQLKSSSASVWKISRAVLRHIAAGGSKEASSEKVTHLRSIHLLKNANDSLLRRLADALEPINFNKGDKIIEQGEKGDVFYLLKEGTVVCHDRTHKNEAEDVVLSNGDYFGELALLNDKPRQRDVVVLSEKCVCFSLSRSDFISMCGSLSGAMAKDLGYRVLRSIPQLEKLENNDCRKLSGMLTMKRYRKGEAIIKEGEPGNEAYIVMSGTVTVTVKKKKIVSLRAGRFFGEAALIDNKPRNATVIADADDVQCYSLSKTVFKEQLKKVEVSLRHMKEMRAKMLPDGQAPPLNDLEEIVLLGTGTFGRVFLVKNKNNKSVKENVTWAMKTMKKKQIAELKMTDNVMQETKVMQECDHPFLLGLIATYQDKNLLYMLLEFIQGGELFNLLDKFKRLNAGHARLYAACVLDAFIYMHDKDIIYRDLKPENLLIDSAGYIRIIDFGFAKHVPRGEKTFTLCGTPEYLAPEIVLRKGHNAGADYWAIGILIWEMLAVDTPFVDQSGKMDHRVVCSNIVRLDPTKKMPREIDAKSKSLLSKLLEKNCAKRLGCLVGRGEDIRNQPFFQGFQWEKLRNKELPTPWKPSLRNGNMDTTNFDAYDDEEHPSQGGFRSVAKANEYRGEQNWSKEFGPFIEATP